MSRDPDLLPSLRELGDRLGDAAARELEAERAAPTGRRRPRRQRRRRWLIAGVAVALLAAGGVGAAELFTGTGDPVPGERDPRDAPAQPGVLADSAAPDPAGGPPWALRVFVDERGRECFQLGRLRAGRLGTVARGQFRPFAGRPTGPCGDLARDPLLVAAEQQRQPPRTVLYGLSGGRGPVRIRVGGETRTVQPGGLGAFVAVYGGLPDLADARVTATIDGRPVRRGPP